MKILGINGSSPFDTKGEYRPYGGSTLKLLNKVLEATKPEGKFHGYDVETDVVHLHDEIEGFYPGNYGYLPDSIIPLFRKIIEADALVIASPVQWYAMSDYMKSFIGHCTALEGGSEELGAKFPGLKLKPRRQLAGKVAAFIATCHHDGCMMVIQSMIPMFNDSGVIIAGGGASFYRNANWKADPDDEDGDWQNLDHQRTGENLVRETIKQLRTADMDVNNWESREAA